MILTIKNMTTSDLLNLDSDIRTMRERDKLSPDVHLNKETGLFELSIDVDDFSISTDQLYIRKNYVEGVGIIPIIRKRNFIIETEV